MYRRSLSWGSSSWGLLPWGSLSWGLPFWGLLCAGAALLAAFAGLGLLARDGTDIDDAVGGRLDGVWRGPAGTVAEVVSVAAGPVLPVVLGVGLLIAAARDRHRRWLLVRVLIVLGVCRLTSAIGKPLFARDRPREFPDFSYPSGHVTSVAATGVAVVLLSAWLAPRLLRVAAASAVGATVLCAASRIVLDVHWLTDTVGAVLAVSGAGLATATLVGLVPFPATRAPAGQARVRSGS